MENCWRKKNIYKELAKLSAMKESGKFNIKHKAFVEKDKKI